MVDVVNTFYRIGLAAMACDLLKIYVTCVVEVVRLTDMVGLAL